jgi:hypothetical protein
MFGKARKRPKKADMKTKCPYCAEILKIPNVYQNQTIKCIYCKEDFVPKNYNFFVLLRAKITKKNVPYLGIALIIIYPFVASPYARNLMIFFRYLILHISILSSLILIRRKILQKFPSIKTGSALIIWFFLLFLMFLYAKNDYRMKRQIDEDGTIFYDKFTLWEHRIIYRDILSDPNLKIPFWSMEGPMASRPGTDDYPQMHGRWETDIFTRNDFSHTYKWYWYGDEISEGVWISRTKK